MTKGLENHLSCMSWTAHSQNSATGQITIYVPECHRNTNLDMKIHSCFSSWMCLAEYCSHMDM